MKLKIRTKLLIGFALLLVLSSLIQAFSFSITRSYISSQINDAQIQDAQKGATEIENFFTDLNSINFGLAHIYKEQLSIVDPSAKVNLINITQYIIINNEQIK